MFTTASKRPLVCNSPGNYQYALSAREMSEDEAMVFELEKVRVMKLTGSHPLLWRGDFQQHLHGS
jgi:hypothetical protein